MHRPVALAVLAMALASCHGTTEAPEEPVPAADTLRVVGGALECDACVSVEFALAGPDVRRFGAGAFVRDRGTARDTAAVVSLRRITGDSGAALLGQASVGPAARVGTYDLELVPGPGSGTTERRIVHGALRVTSVRPADPPGEPPVPPDAPPPPPPPPAEPGFLAVTVEMSGVELPDSAVVLAASDLVGDVEFVVAPGIEVPVALRPGSYRVSLEWLPVNCVQAPPADLVGIVARETVRVTIRVTCVPAARIRVSVGAFGADVPRPLLALCDDGACGQVVFAPGMPDELVVRAGPHVLALANLPARCASRAETVEAIAGQTVEARLEVTCAPFFGFARLELRVTGPAPTSAFIVTDVTDGCDYTSCDPFGYLNAGEATVLQLPPGPRRLLVVGGPSNCSILTPQPMEVLVQSGLTLDLEVAVECR